MLHTRQDAPGTFKLGAHQPLGRRHGKAPPADAAAIARFVGRIGEGGRVARRNSPSPVPFPSLWGAAAYIAHEVTQPLSAIVCHGSAGLRLLSTADPELGAVRASLQRILDDAHHAADMIASIRALFRNPEQKRARIDVNEVVDDVLKQFKHAVRAQGISLKRKLSPMLPEIAADRIQLHQVFSNLIRNAVEAVTTGTGPRLLLIESAPCGRDRVAVKVEDSGVGLKVADPERIFEPFFTTKAQGMGLGLSISRWIAESHGGTLTVAPRRPQGSRFQLVLPVGSAQCR